MIPREQAHAFEVYGDPAASGPLVVTCEHASNRVPPRFEVTPEDERVLQMHWGWDIGAGDVAREVIARTTSCGVLSRFSRLVIDPNRDENDPTLIIEEAEGHPLTFNRSLDADERNRRLDELFEAYHGAIDAVIRRRLGAGDRPMLFSVHSFTPVYEGESRAMEMGVLFDRHEEPARQFAEALRNAGFETALNQPYSGFDGVISSAARHGANHDLVYLELEIRQDLLAEPERRPAVAHRVIEALNSLL